MDGCFAFELFGCWYGAAISERAVSTRTVHFAIVMTVALCTPAFPRQPILDLPMQPFTVVLRYFREFQQELAFRFGKNFDRGLPRLALGWHR